MVQGLIWLVLITGLSITSQYNYLLFHSVAEWFSIVIGCTIFIISWHTRTITNNSYFAFLGTGYLFVALIDAAHTLSYQGMSIFPGSNHNIATQLWIGARYMQSIILLISPFTLKRKISDVLLLSVFLFITILLLATIFVWQTFPDCFREGQGLTTFKKSSEYIICLVLCGSIYTR